MARSEHGLRSGSRPESGPRRTAGTRGTIAQAPSAAGDRSGRGLLHWPLVDLPGLSPGDRAGLASLGLVTTGDLLRSAHSRPGQQAIATRLNLHEHHVRKWAALADLARVPSVGCQFCGLLLHVGIVSTAALAEANAGRLHHQILRFQVSELRRRDLAPATAQVSQWIAQARAIVQARHRP